MRCQLTLIGCEYDIGEERLILDDEQVGEITVREIEINSLADIDDLLDQADRVQFEQSNWEKYDAELTVICDHF